MVGEGVQGLYRDLDRITASNIVTGLSDVQLLERFVERDGDIAELAFETIVQRHGPMVLGVCRSVLQNSSDTDDAFQATFLVLAKKAGSVRVVDSLAPWLFVVARRVATRARSVAQKRRFHEATASNFREQKTEGANLETLDFQPILFEELDRLPEKYRSPIILCHLDGLSHDEAARRLRWPIGTLSCRLSRARNLLKSRLARRGLSASVAYVFENLLQSKANAVPLSLARTTLQSALKFVSGSPIPSSIHHLVRGVLTTMLITRLTLVLGAVSALGLLTAVAGLVFAQVKSGAPVPKKKGAELARVIAPQPKSPEPAPGERPAVLKNGTPTLARPTLPIVYNDAIISVTPKDGRSINAMIVKDGVWQDYRPRENVRLTPLLSNDVLAPGISGTEVREVAALSTSPDAAAAGNSKGKWVRQSLVQPVNGQVFPIVLAGLAFYHIDKEIYAFSAMTNSWDALHLEGAAAPKISPGKTNILVEQGDTLYVFSISRGKWSKGLKVPIPEK